MSDLVYPNSLAPIKMCSDCETFGLLNHCKQKMTEEVTRKCVWIVRHGLPRSDSMYTYNFFRGMVLPEHAQKLLILRKGLVAPMQNTNRSVRAMMVIDSAAWRNVSARRSWIDARMLVFRQAHRSRLIPSIPIPESRVEVRPRFCNIKQKYIKEC